MKELVAANSHALQQVLTLISSVNDTAYVEVAEGMTSSMGRHVRHILDHYAALQLGAITGEIDYDLRSRDSHVEIDTAQAKNNVLAVIAWMKENVTDDMALKMKTEISMLNQKSVCFNSSLKRELTYLQSHTMHHVALVTMALRIMGINIDDNIGIAPATLSYLRDNKTSDSDMGDK